MTPSILTALCLAVGVWCDEHLHIMPSLSVSVLTLCVAGSFLLTRNAHSRGKVILLLIAGAALGSSRSAVERQRLADASQLWLRFTDAPSIRVRGTICSLPTVRVVAEHDGSISAQNPRYRTAFLLQSAQVLTRGVSWPVRGRLRVIVDGDASGRVKWGDETTVTGRLQFQEGPANPGELDFAEYSRRQGVCAAVFVRHPLALRADRPISRFDPRYWLSLARRTVSGLLQQLSPPNRPIAEALLLGNRGFLSDETEFGFISSGTMHLLAISGLHVGILYVFLVRVLLVLKCRLHRAQFAAFLLCLSYGMLTDLRPSVMRAVVFIGLHVLSQRLLRSAGIPSLVSLTAILFLLYDPGVLFNSGGWLSFLAVTALGLSGSPTRPDTGVLPPDDLSFGERLRSGFFRVGAKLAVRYRQMLAVCLATAPLVAAQFHVISATGLLINVLLIPITGGILIVGFSLVAVGLILPEAAAPWVVVFDLCLTGLRTVVMTAASVSFGSVTIADCAPWLIALLYLSLVLTRLRARPRLVRLAWGSLGLLLPLSLWAARQPPEVHGPRLTVLSVGHGNASVLETTGGDVFLFDAGALGRAERTADVVCRYLWSQGHRKISAIVLSHPDLDHYNGVEGILRRMVVGRVITTRGFARSDAAAARRVLSAVRELRIPLRIARSGDQIHGAGYHIRLVEVDEALRVSPVDAGEPLGDNDRSLVSVIRCNTVVCLPGDLEERGQVALRATLPACDILVAPHHGSSDANTAMTADVFAPKHVIVSSRDIAEAPSLSATYGPERRLWFTSESGAITADLQSSRPAISTWRTGSGPATR